MDKPPPGMTNIEWLESIIPPGDTCSDCENIVSGKCSTWGQDVDSNSKKCKWCLRNKYLGNVRKSKEIRE